LGRPDALWASPQDSLFYIRAAAKPPQEQRKTYIWRNYVSSSLFGSTGCIAAKNNRS
jgi:hypothetical protein